MAKKNEKSIGLRKVSYLSRIYEPTTDQKKLCYLKARLPDRIVLPIGGELLIYPDIFIYKPIFNDETISLPSDEVCNSNAIWDVYNVDGNINPLSRKFIHDLDWLFKVGIGLNSTSYAIEQISSYAGGGKIASQSSFHSLENKKSGLCDECGSDRIWDQKHNELICLGCGLVYSNVPEEALPWLEDHDFIEQLANEEDYTEAYGDRFIEYYNPGLANSVLPNYGNLSDDELDLMVGERN